MMHVLTIAACLFAQSASEIVPPEKGLTAVPHGHVQLDSGFWADRQKTHHETTVSHALDCLEADGHVTNFDLAAGRYDGPLRGHHAFDSDLHKALEGALIDLQHYEDASLRTRVDHLLDRVLAAQQPDGFLITYYIVQDADKRWENLRLEHQLYNAGHFFEMATEHYRLTGERSVLDAACRFADHIDSVFGPGKRYDVGGHEEVELALIKLYRATGEPRYLDLARFFLDERGHAHGASRAAFDPASQPTEIPTFEELPESERSRAYRRFRNSIRNGRMQDHKPLVEQDQAIGHAVRAGYVYSAMADIARFSDAPEYERAVKRIWQDVVSHKMYITGGVGTAQYHDEGYGDPYLLPNRTYCESCANIANVFWQHRMNLLTGESKYADVMELALYNGALSGIAIAGDRFFYQNTLASNGAQRSSWIGLSCCPTNLTRFIPQVGGFAYAQDQGKIYVNLYLSGEATAPLADQTSVKLTQATNYPWDGRVRINVDPERAEEFEVCLRIPGWSRGRPVPSDLYRFGKQDASSTKVTVNGKSSNPTPGKDGYVHLNRLWQSGDVIELELPMPIRRVYANPLVEADRGKVAIMRGPIVYCLEGVDHAGVDVSRLALSPDAELTAEHRSNLLGGVTVIQGTATVDGRSTPLNAIPYYAWCNREKGAMTVWIDESQP